MTKQLCFLVVTLLLLTRLAAGDNQRLVVVVAKTSKVTNIARVDLKRAFLGDSISITDVRIVPFNAEPKTDQRAGFDRAILGMTPDQAGRFWIDRKVRGEGAAPRSLPAVHLAKVIAKFPGAIGYLPIDQLTADVVPIKIDGVVYTDARYPLGLR